MALDPANSVTWFMCVAAEHSDYLGAIRHWNNLKIAFEDGVVWVKDLTARQVDLIEVKTIPYKELYYAEGHQLFLHGSRLPDRNIPSLLWTPIERGLPVRLPSFNHNYFGIHDQVRIRLVASGKENEVVALMVTMDVLQAYMETAPAIRLKNLQWALVDTDKAIITGFPVLPLKGEVFWCTEDFFIPAGYELDLYALAGTINALLNAEKKYWIVWNTNGAYWKLDKALLKPLSISSFRLSVKQ